MSPQSPPILCVLIDQQLGSGVSWTDQAASAPVTDDNANNGGWGPGLLHYPPLLSFSELNISNKTPVNKGWWKIEEGFKY